MKKYVKTIALSLALILTMSMFSGCGKTDAGEGKRTTLRVSIFERGNVPAGAGLITDNAMTKWIQENFGDPNNVDVEFVSIPRAQELQQLNVLMSAGDAPDIVFTYDYATVYNYYQQGGLCDLTEYMDDATQLKELMGEEHLKYGQIDGKQILIPGKTMQLGTSAQVIRQDWLDKLGLPVPTTTDELYNTLKAFKEKDPGNLGDKTIPYGISLHYPHYYNLVRSFIDYDSMSDMDKNCMTDFMMPGAKEGFRFLNKLYNEGLISKDFALDKDRKQVEADFANGYVGFMSDDVGRPLATGGTYDTLRETVPGAKLTALDTFSDAKGRHPKEIGTGVSLYIAVPKTSKCPDVAVQYLNWMANDDVLMTLQNGFEGTNYNLSENGIPVEIVNDEAQKIHWGRTLAMDLAIIVNGLYMKDTDKRNELALVTYGDKKDLAAKCMEYSLVDGWSKKIMPPTDAYTKYSSVVAEKGEMIYVKAITAPVDQFDSVYDSIYNEYMQAGQQKIYEENCEMYKKMFGNNK